MMSAIAFGVPVQFDKAHIEGISKLQAADIKYAEQLGYRIKLLGITRRRENGIELRVHPTLIPSTRLVANVEGAMNAVVVHGDAVGSTLFYGKGAAPSPRPRPSWPTWLTSPACHRRPRPPRAASPSSPMPSPTPRCCPSTRCRPPSTCASRVADQAGVLARITTILAEHDISIDAVLQRESAEGERQTDVIILTHDTIEGRMADALQRCKPTHRAGSIVKLRKEELA